MDTITRSVPFTIDSIRTSEDGDGLTLAGYAAVFNSPTRIRGEQPREFDEVIAPGAFARSLQRRTPVLMFDHGQHPLIGSLPIGSIHKIKEDGRGLYIEARLADNWLVQPVRDAIANNSIDGMSFRFNIAKDKETWDRSGSVPLRTLREVSCPELGPVVFPAYTDTSVAVRSLANQLDPETRAAIVDVFRDLAVTDTERDAADAAEDTDAMAIIEQIKPLVGQLVALEGESLQAGDDVTGELSTLVNLLSSLSCYEDMNDPTDMPAMGMNSETGTHHELATDGTSSGDSASTSDSPPDSTQSAGARNRVIRELILLGAIQ